jgi:hypothetical protein
MYTWIGDFSSPSVDVPPRPSPSALVAELPVVHHTTIRSRNKFCVKYSFFGKHFLNYKRLTTGSRHCGSEVGYYARKYILPTSMLC